MKTLLAAIVAVMTLTTFSQKPGEAFDKMFARELDAAKVAGGSYVVMKDGRIAAEGYHGSADAATKRPTDSGTIYHWASNTKAFTGIAIMQLRDRGKLDLDDPVTKYLPELRAVRNPFGSMDKITIRHLMTHSAGFRNPTWPWAKGEAWEPFEPREYSQLVAMLPYTNILFEPGTKFSYSNPGIIFLGRIIEQLSGDDYEVYIDKNILKPLRMYATFFDKAPYHLLEQRSHSYFIEKGVRREAPFDFDSGITVSNGGLNSPLADMKMYLEFLIGVPAKQAQHDLVLKRSSLEEMWRPQLPTPVDANGNGGVTTDIGMIYFLDRRDGRTFIGHSGDQNGFLSYLDLDPARRTASLIVINTNDLDEDSKAGDQRMTTRLRKAIRAEY